MNLSQDGACMKLNGNFKIAFSITQIAYLTKIYNNLKCQCKLNCLQILLPCTRGNTHCLPQSNTLNINVTVYIVCFPCQSRSSLKVKVLVAQSCPALCNSMDCSPPGSSICGIFQARILEWVAISSSRGVFLTQGLKPGLLHCRHVSEPPGKQREKLLGEQ